MIIPPLVIYTKMVFNSGNNTPQAYPLLWQRDAQTGGFLFVRGGCRDF